VFWPQTSFLYYVLTVQVQRKDSIPEQLPQSKELWVILTLKKKYADGEIIFEMQIIFRLSMNGMKDERGGERRKKK